MDISKYNLSEILFILDDGGIGQDINISTSDTHMIIKTNVCLSNPHLRKINGHMINNLKNATKQIRNWLNNNGGNYTVNDDCDPTEEGFIHVIDIEEIN